MRCFVAAWPTPGVLSALGNLPRPAADGVRWTTPDQWHVTLRFFGELTETDVAVATTSLRRAACSLPAPPLPGRPRPPAPLEAHGGPATRFLGPGLIVWPVEGLAASAKAVEAATAEIGQPVPDRRFLGHLTIARGRRGVDLRTQRDLLAPLDMSWAVTSLSLVRSDLHPEGARYGVVASFPTGGGGG